MEKVIQIYKALSDGTRIRIVNILQGKRLCVNRIAEVLGIQQAKISRHLFYLKNVGLVNSEKDGLRVYYTLPDDGLCQPVIKCLKELRKDVIELDEDIKRLNKEKSREESCC
ncbi:MAG: winged helix-turn-helix transcriptional regulator [Deltaproteobacteria bacterium]|nr:winged helix-turn-helix transcriptional regulator [Deltaproteobacteria bacterium]